MAVSLLRVNYLLVLKILKIPMRARMKKQRKTKKMEMKLKRKIKKKKLI